MLINSYISSSNYFFEEEKSRCYLVNEKTHREFLLEGFFADLWNVILNTQDYQKVKEYAKSKNIEHYLDDFLHELTDVGVIKNDTELTVKQDGISAKDLNEEDILSLQKREWLKNNNFLFQLVMELSYKCNLRCKHCYNDKDDFETEIDFKTAKKIIDDAIELGVNNVYISSGECTISRDFLEIAKYIRTNKLPLIFVTNGQTLYDDEILFDNIVNLYPHRIKVSLYSMNPEIHDNITGVKGSCEKTIAVIKKLRQHNILVTINYFQLSLNKNSLDDIIKFKNEVGAALSVDLYFLDNRDNKNTHVQATEEQLYELYSDVNGPCHCLVGQKSANASKNDESLVCDLMKSMLSVSPSQDVFPCIALKCKLGNLKETTLKNIWNNDINHFLDGFKVKNLKDCRSCKNFEYCIYCPSMGLYENGFLEKSDICCKLTKIRMDVWNKEKN